MIIINFLPASLLITFANSLDPDQAEKTSGLIWIHNVDTLMVFLKEIFEKVRFEKKKKSKDNQKACKIVQ